MPYAPNLKLQVWYEEVESSVRSTQDALDEVENIYARLRHQEAPPDLIEHVFEAKADLDKALATLDRVRHCFPTRPR
jgi:hypothetical protein